MLLEQKTVHVVLFKIIDENVYRENESTRDMICYYSLDPLLYVVVETARGLFDESVAHETGTLVEWKLLSIEIFFFCN